MNDGVFVGRTAQRDGSLISSRVLQSDNCDSSSEGTLISC